MEYKCSGCKSSWTEKCYVKEHVIQNMQTFFCLNCDDYIKDKTQVFNKGWTLVDEHGFLRRDLQIGTQKVKVKETKIHTK